jgi:tetratricopeptide (TPR) repeat protein
LPRRRAVAETWEAFLALARNEERLGRPAEAERAYRKAFDLGPASPRPQVELARFLHAADRADEAAKLLKSGAAKAAKELLAGAERPGSASGDLFYLLEFGPYRRAFLESVGAKDKGLERLETALRRTLARSPRAGARTLLAEVLVARRRFKAAESELAEAFQPDSREADNSRLEVLLKLIDAGRCGRGLERAVLDCAARSQAGDALRREWVQVFSALMCARLYTSAFQLGETILEKAGRLDSPGQLMYPWWRKHLRSMTERPFLLRELAGLDAAAKTGGFPHWFAYYRAILADSCGRHSQALREYENLRDLDPERYSWMFESFVMAKLAKLDFDGAADVCRTVLRRWPSHWWVRCRLGEALLAKGDVPSGLREFERGLEAAAPAARREVLTWFGEIFLWLGDYEKALERLNEAVRLGASTFVYGWRGAARFKTGEFDAALTDLDRAVALDPKDLEALCWRGEVYRTQGRSDDALRDLDRVIRSEPAEVWAFFNRALLKGDLGDERGMSADFAAIPRETTDFLRGGLGLETGADLGPGEMRRVLEDGLRRANGVRRREPYAQAVWMRSRP